MNGIDNITRQIEADTKTEIQEVMAQAQTQADEITKDYSTKVQALEKNLQDKGVNAANQREARLASMAQMESRKLTLATKQDMVGKAFEKALHDMTTMPDNEYIALLVELLLKASNTGREQVIFSAKDRARFGKAVVTKANEALAKQVAPKLPSELTGSRAGAVIEKVFNGASALLNGTAMLTLAEESRPMAGGLILRDDKVETNCSFEVLIHLQRDTLAAEVAKVLF